MKRIITFTLILLTVNISTGRSQNINLKFEKDSSLTRILNSISYYKVYPTSQLAVSVIVVGNESGSANMPETDEVSHKVFIGISEYDEYPKRMLYFIDELYEPRDYKVVEKDPNNISLKFTYGPKLKPQFVELKITSQGITKLKL